MYKSSGVGHEYKFTSPLQQEDTGGVLVCAHTCVSVLQSQCARDLYQTMAIMVVCIDIDILNASLILGLLKHGMKSSSHVALHLRDIKFFHGLFGTGVNLTRIALISGPWCWIQDPVGGQRKEETSWNDSEQGGKKKWKLYPLCFRSPHPPHPLPQFIQEICSISPSWGNPCLPLWVFFVI